jgi:hypothetical protein
MIMLLNGPGWLLVLGPMPGPIVPPYDHVSKWSRLVVAIRPDGRAQCPYMFMVLDGPDWLVVCRPDGNCYFTGQTDLS